MKVRVRTSLWPEEVKKIGAKLGEANQAFVGRYPGESNRRQAVHTVYGGAHLFKSDSAQRLGAVALRSLQEYAKDAATLARVLGYAEDALAQKIFERVTEKLQREAIEDFRLDFEDGYG
ncbi:MAG: phosphoenolpyruvate kinase, partial [Verrucomicrobiota bacterium]|nr:phosphoenolpyruvate kinase [Verrucomicrobiota bacterium]